MQEEFETPETTITMQCFHCGNQTVGTILFQYERVDEEDSRREFFKKNTSLKWFLMKCENCGKPTFLQSIQIQEAKGSQAYYGTGSLKTTSQRSDVLYPGSKVPLTQLPKQVEGKYMEALRVSVISPSACAVQVRKTLEAICQHENAQGKVLADKLKNLAEIGRIPEPLVNVAIHLRQLGNLGAHFDEDEVTKDDVQIILDFVELLLEYLYVAPAKIEAMQKRLNKH